jgi:hypothetical protein
MNLTIQQYKKAVNICRNVFEKKLTDYGTAWRILRTSSLTDQIFIKAQRIRSLETLAEAKVKEGITPEFIGIVNYAVIALIQIEINDFTNINLKKEEALLFYDKYIEEAKSLMQNKNHDYGEAWRDMRVSSFTDLILMKILRTKQIEDNQGKTIVSEGVDANYFDMINYSIFALIKLEIEKMC